MLQKRALRLMYFFDSRAHAIPLSVRSGVLPVNMLHFKYTANLMHEITNNRAPSRFILTVLGFQLQVIFYVQRSRLDQLLLSFSRTGARIWNKIPLKLRKQRKAPFKCKLHKLLLKVLETEEVYVDISAITRSQPNSLFG